MNSSLAVFRSGSFDRWLRDLRDRQARRRIAVRIDRLAYGHVGDARALRGGVCELRIDYGPGYRVYFMRRGVDAVVLLYGGDKSTQPSDIERAIVIAEDW